MTDSKESSNDTTATETPVPANGAAEVETVPDNDTTATETPTEPANDATKTEVSPAGDETSPPTPPPKPSGLTQGELGKAAWSYLHASALRVRTAQDLQKYKGMVKLFLDFYPCVECLNHMVEVIKKYALDKKFKAISNPLEMARWHNDFHNGISKELGFETKPLGNTDREIGQALYLKYRIIDKDGNCNTCGAGRSLPKDMPSLLLGEDSERRSQSGAPPPLPFRALDSSKAKQQKKERKRRKRIMRRHKKGKQ